MNHHTHTHYWARHGLSILILVLLQACIGDGFELATIKKPDDDPEVATQDAKVTAVAVPPSDDEAHTSHLRLDTRPSTTITTRVQETETPRRLPRKRSLENNAYGRGDSKRQKQPKATERRGIAALQDKEIDLGSAPRDAAPTTQNTVVFFTHPPAITRYGFKAKRIANDGNCLFRAVADQIEYRLQMPFGRDMTPYKLLRRIAVQHIASNVGLYKPYTDAQTVAAVEKLMSDIAQDRTWAGDEALVILSRALQLTIVVIKDDAQDVPIYKPVHSQGTIYLYYKDRSHYESLYKDDVLGAGERIDKLLQSAATDSSFKATDKIALADLLKGTASDLAKEQTPCDLARVVSEQYSGRTAGYHHMETVYDDQDNDTEVLKPLKLSLRLREHTFGARHPCVAPSHHNLGSVYRNRGNYKEALKHYQVALNIWETTLSGYNLYVATSHHNLGSVCADQGNYEEALKYLKHGLQLRIAALGKDHPDVGASYCDIGTAYRHQGNYAEALKHLNQGLALRIAALGENDLAVANGYNNIGNVYADQGNNAEALKYLKKGLLLKVAILGEHHPSVATSHNNIGSVYAGQGNYAEALKHLEQGLQLRIAALGKNHSHVASSYCNIGFLYEQQDNCEQALEYIEQGLKIFECTLGKEHPHTQRATESLERLQLQVSQWHEYLSRMPSEEK